MFARGHIQKKAGSKRMPKNHRVCPQQRQGISNCGFRAADIEGHVAHRVDHIECIADLQLENLEELPEALAELRE